MISSSPGNSSQASHPAAAGSPAWRMIARGVAAAHLAFSLFVVAGSLLVLRWPGLIWIHVAAIAWAVATMIFDLGCPLTPWEKQSWRRGGRVPYDEGFLQHHVLRWQFDPANSRRNHIILGVVVLAFNIGVYSLII